jgi:hypothetical protein
MDEISAAATKRSLYIGLAVVGVAITLLQLSCYVAFFGHMFNHDNNVAAKVIKPAALRQRNRFLEIPKCYTLT